MEVLLKQFFINFKVSHHESLWVILNTSIISPRNLLYFKVGSLRRWSLFVYGIFASRGKKVGLEPKAETIGPNHVVLTATDAGYELWYQLTLDVGEILQGNYRDGSVNLLKFVLKKSGNMWKLIDKLHSLLRFWHCGVKLFSLVTSNKPGYLRGN